MNKLLTKIVGVALGATMAVGVGVAAVKASDGGMQRANAAEAVAYTLDGTKTATGNNYSSATTLTQDGVEWDVVGNTEQNPWRIGGKSISKVDRTVQSNGVVSTNNITKVVLTTGASSGAITVNSLSLLVGTSAGGSQTSTVSGTYTASSSITFNRPSEADWSSKYFTFVFNVTVSGTSNKYVSFANAKFYYDASGPVTYTVTYDGNGNTSGDVPTDGTSYTSGQQVTVLGNTGNLAKEDYEFAGWNTAADGSGTSYVAGGQFTIQANTTLYAKWAFVDPVGYDYLNRAFTGVSGNSYVEWSDKVGSSGAIYAGKSGGDKDSIQLRSKDSDCGLITTGSGGLAEKVILVWQGDTAEGRTINVYGKNTPYSAASDLYSEANQGTLIGTIVKGTSTELSIADDYRYIGLRSSSDALYLTSIKIKWSEAPLEPAVTLDKSEISMKVTDTEGVVVTATVQDVASPTYSWSANNSNVTLENTSTRAVTIKPNTETDATSEVTVTVGGVTPVLTATVSVTILTLGPGDTPELAYTIQQAKAAIDAETGVTGVYAKGYVSQVDEVSIDHGNATYWISNTGSTESAQLEVYRGKYLDGANFTSEDQIQVGDFVIVYGDLIKYNDTYEFAQGNRLYSISRPAPAGETVTWSRSGSVNTLTSGYSMRLENYSNGTDYYQDKGSGVGLDIGFEKSTAMWTTDCPTTRSLTVTIGGGSTKDPLDYNVYAYFLDENHDLITASETLVTSKVTSKNGSDFTVTMPSTNNVYGLAITHEKESGFNVRAYGISFTYGNEQTAVEKYISDFFDLMSTGDHAACKADGSSRLEDLQIAWAILALRFTTDLTAEERSQFTGGTASESGTDLQKVLALYDYVATKYNTRLQSEDCTAYNFMSRSITPATNSINPINKVNNTVAIVVVVTISLVSVSALGAYFLLRKKKEER
jgi:hypothetical protein